MYVRRSARVALLDPDDAVLLLRSRFRRVVAGLEWAWFLPGGGVETDESLEEAAVRELVEETGIELDPAALQHLAFAHGDGTVGNLTGPMRDDVFVAAAPATNVSTVAMEDHERRALDTYRWWPLPELACTEEPVFPIGLAATLGDFVSARSWATLRRLPW